MKTKPLVMLCWVQVVIAAIFVLLNFYVLVERPMTGFDYSKSTGKVLNVAPEGPGARAGIAAGDRLLSINNYPVAIDVVPLFFESAGDSVPVVFEHEGVRHDVQLHVASEESLRRASLRAGGVRTLWAISRYLNFPLHIWMMGLGIALLVLRPDNKDARVSALTLVYWAGSVFIYQAAGFGPILDATPAVLRVPMFVLDAWFCAAFFAAVAHFALIFPSDRVGRLRPVWEFVPYVVSLPIFVETLANDMQRLRGDVHPAALPFRDASSSVGTFLLVAALMSLPVIGLAIFFYAHRQDSLAMLLTGTPALYLLLIIPLVAMIHYRKHLLERLDRRFFREQYDARHLLLHVVSIIRGGSDMLALSRAALDEIDKALHPKHISLWQVDPDGGELYRGFYRGGGQAILPVDGDRQHRQDCLSSTGTLASLLITDDDPLDVFHRGTRALLQRMPDAEREWLTISDAYLIVPMLIV